MLPGRCWNKAKHAFSPYTFISSARFFLIFSGARGDNGPVFFSLGLSSKRLLLTVTFTLPSAPPAFFIVLSAMCKVFSWLSARLNFGLVFLSLSRSLRNSWRESLFEEAKCGRFLLRFWRSSPTLRSEKVRLFDLKVGLFEFWFIVVLPIGWMNGINLRCWQ